MVHRLIRPYSWMSGIKRRCFTLFVDVGSVVIRRGIPRVAAAAQERLYGLPPGGYNYQTHLDEAVNLSHFITTRDPTLAHGI